MFVSGLCGVWLDTLDLQAPPARVDTRVESSSFNNHVEGTTATLSKWPSQGESRIQTFATHQLGVGAAVINSATNEIFQDNTSQRNCWLRMVDGRARAHFIDRYNLQRKRYQCEKLSSDLSIRGLD